MHMFAYKSSLFQVETNFFEPWSFSRVIEFWVFLGFFFGFSAFLKMLIVKFVSLF